MNPTKLIGSTILIYGYRGDEDYRLVRVDSVRNTHHDLIALKTIQRNMMTRGEWQITVTDLVRGGQRSYYVSRCDRIIPVGWFGRQWHRMMVKLNRRYNHD